MRIILAILFIPLVFTGCGVFTPQRQCEVISTTAKFGIQIALERTEKTEEFVKHATKAAEIINKQILPRLEGGETKPITREDLDWCLDLLNKELNGIEKMAIQTGINLILSYIPNFPNPGEEVDSFTLRLLLCLFKGAAAGFSEYFAPGAKDVVQYTLVWEVQS